MPGLSPPVGFFLLDVCKAAVVFERIKALPPAHGRLLSVTEHYPTMQGMSCLCRLSSTSNDSAAVRSQAVIH